MVDDKVNKTRAAWLYLNDEGEGEFNPLENRQLKEALLSASEATKHIVGEQSRLRLLLSEAQSDIERAAREFQIEYVEKYLTRASELAKKRLAYFETLTTTRVIDAELKLCARNKEHWFEMYAWGYDPRARTPLAIVPFELFPTQKNLILWLDDIVFNRRTSGLIEKARDEGATETIIRWGLHNWRWREGFSMLLSTRNENEVDQKKNPNTLFGRARFQLRLLPSWMLPAGFDLDRSMNADMLLENPSGGNTLKGEAPTENMGRGGRVTVAMLDEFAFFRYAGYPQFRAMSQTTDSIIMPSSVAGKLNQQADLAFDNLTPKFVMDWRDNPFKDKRWYDSLPYGYISPKMSLTTIAQEVDRNYEAAQPGKVWKYREEHIFITLDEFLKPFKEAKLGHRFVDSRGKFKIPDDWRVVRTSDYGQSEGHDWSYQVFGQPRANYPLSDTHFCFIGQNLEPTGLTTEQAVKQWREIDHGLGLRDARNNWLHKPVMSYNSHEQADLRKVLLGTYGETWTAWNTDYMTGIEQIQDWWTPIEKEKVNPFRDELSGRCRLIFVSLCGEYQLAFNERQTQYFVTSSVTEGGFITLRKQISAYHYDEKELGKAARAMRPVKDFDDICFVAGTLIKTKRGEVPIECITTDDLVLTRKGWKPVLGCGLTNKKAETYTLTTRDGRQLTGTGSHPIFTNRGIVGLRGLLSGDIIYVCQKQKPQQKPSFIKESSLIGIPKQNKQRIEGITTRPSPPVSKVLNHFILRFGRTFLAKSRKAGTSIIKTTTTAITTFPTLNVFQVSSIGNATRLSVRCAENHLNNSSICQEYDIWRMIGTKAKKGENGTVNTASGFGKSESRLKKIVHIVKRFFTQKPFIKSIVQTFANGAKKVMFQWKSTGAIALFVEQSLCLTEQKTKYVAINDVCLSIVGNKQKQSVYNLTVAECPEYFANEILVHNCDGLRGYSVMWNRQPIALNDAEQFEAHINRDMPYLSAAAIENAPVGDSRSQKLASLIEERGKFYKDKKKDYDKSDTYAGIAHEQNLDDSMDWIGQL